MKVRDLSAHLETLDPEEEIIAVQTVVMVNSLGPSEPVVHYFSFAGAEGSCLRLVNSRTER